MSDLAGLKALMLEAPETQLDKSIHPLIEQWDDVSGPTAIQVLEVLDKCIYSAACSDFVIMAFEVMLNACLEREGKTLDELVPLATWREEV